MKKLLVTLFLFFSFQSVFADTAESTLSGLLSNYTSYQAHFSQVNYDQKQHALQRSQGQVFMLRPGRFRWETKQPYQQILIANGNTVWVYDVDLKQATEQSLAKGGFNPAELLTRPVNDLAQKFTTVQQPDGWFQLTPNQPGRGFKLAFLQFKNGQLTGLKIVNQLNQTNVFNFDNIQVNHTLSPNLFQFKPPAGVEVLKNKTN